MRREQNEGRILLGRDRQPKLPVPQKRNASGRDGDRGDDLPRDGARRACLCR